MMYTEQDLANAIASKNYLRVAEISTYLANQPEKPTKVRPKKVNKEDLSDTNGTPSWMAPSLAGRPKKFDKNGKELVEGKFESIPTLDHSQIRFETEKGPAPNLTTAQKRTEKLKKTNRDFSMNRDPVDKIEVQCEGCGKTFSVYPSALSQREDEHGVEWCYTCNKCIGRNKRR